MFARLLNHTIKAVLIFLLVFTPFARGSVEIWASSMMEMGILLMILLWSFQQLLRPSAGAETGSLQTTVLGPYLRVPLVLIGLFLAVVILQMVELPAKAVALVSPRTYELRAKMQWPGSLLGAVPISFFAYGTRIEFMKWLTLTGFFLFLLHWNLADQRGRLTREIVVVIFLVGLLETLYGFSKFFTASGGTSALMGSFVNRNHLAGYLLMVIPLSVGFLFSREVTQPRKYRRWVDRVTSLDGKSLIIGFGTVVMIVGLFFSASRMGISSLLFAFTLMILILRSSKGEKRLSKKSILILGLGVLWAASIGLDAVISRFFTTTEDFGTRWMIWKNTAEIVKDFPLLGTGLGTFVKAFPMYRSFHIRGLVTHAENDYLQLASEVGVLGAGLLLVVFLFLFFKAASRVRSLSEREPLRYVGIGSLVGIVALMVHSLVEKNIQVPSNALLWTLLWGLVLRIPSQPSLRAIAFERR